MEDLLQVGVITSTHGIRGEVKVFPTTDDAARFKKLKNVILDNGKERRDLEITSVKFFKNQVILKFKGIDDINDVEKYKKAPLFVTRENAVPLEENEYFIADLIGLSVTSDEGEELGVIDDVLQTGANDVYVVKKAGANDLLIPAIKDCILDVDDKKAPLFVTRENAVPLEENEYFIADLIGLSVTSDEGEELGVIDDVLQTGANDVYVVKKAGTNDLLIPAIKDCILDVDVENGMMKVHLLAGLR